MRITEINSCSVVFDNGYVLTDYHEQDCDERVYVDFKYLQNYVSPCCTRQYVPPEYKQGNRITDLSKLQTIKYGILDTDFDTPLKVQLTQQKGINLVDAYGAKFNIPCCNEQDGYYETYLELVHNFENKCTKQDITECVTPVEEY